MNLAKRMATLDLQEAKASCDKDRLMIQGTVNELLGNFQNMNKMVRRHVSEMLITRSRLELQSSTKTRAS